MYYRLPPRQPVEGIKQVGMFNRLVGIILIINLGFSPFQGGGVVKTNLSESGRPELFLRESSRTGLIIEFNNRYPESTLLALTGSRQAEDSPVPDGYFFEHNHGMPQMLVYSTLVGVPPGVRLNLELISVDSTSLEGRFDIPASPAYTSWDGDGSQPEFFAEIDPATYGRNAYYPSESGILGQEAWLRDQRIIRLHFYPYQYNPQTGRLIWNQRILARLSFTSPDGKDLESEISTGSEIIAPPDHLFDEVLKASLLNYEVAKAWRGFPADQVHQPQPFDELQGHLSSAHIIKIQVDRDGLYSLTYSDLIESGMPSDLDPRYLRLTSQGMEVPIILSTQEDGKLNPGDALYFYGTQFYGDRLAELYQDESQYWVVYAQHQPDGTRIPWRPSFNATVLEQYTNYNTYWLEISEEPGLRVQYVDGNPNRDGFAVAEVDWLVQRAEDDLLRWEFHFTGEDSWFWDGISDANPRSYTTTIPYLAAESFTATVRAEVVSYNFNDKASPDHHAKFNLNDRLEPLQEAYWDGRSRYRMEAQVPHTDLIEGVNRFYFQAYKDAASPIQFYFDWFEIEYLRPFQALEDSFRFNADHDGAWNYTIQGFSENQVFIFDVSNPFDPVRIINAHIEAEAGNYSAAFSVDHLQDAEYFVFTEAQVRKPPYIESYQPTIVPSQGGADYVLITHPDFIEAVQPLAEFRQSQGMRVKTLNLFDIYDEFNYGVPHPIAIKNLLAYTFLNWEPPAPSFVVLIGDGHWNFLNRNPERYGTNLLYMPPNLGWVDPWQGEVDSSSLLAAVVGADPLPDLMIGRIPVNSAEDFSNVFEKIIAYENADPQGWQTRLTFVADDPDQAGNFQAQSEAIILKYIPDELSVERIYLKEFKDAEACGSSPFPGGPACLPVNQAITETLSNTGSLFLNYMGHGAVQSWAKERILFYYEEKQAVPNDYDINDIASMMNGDRLPIVLSMTCLDGFWFHPTVQPSLAELFLLTPERGAVAAFSSTGLGVARGHDYLQQGFYSAIYEHNVWDLGKAILAAKTNLYGSGLYLDLMNTYTLFGDPALHIASPYRTSISSDRIIKSADPGDTLIYTFSVENSGILDDTFSLSYSTSDWMVTGPEFIGSLSPGQTAQVQVSVSVPVDAANGDIYRHEITVASQKDPLRRALVSLETQVQLKNIFIPLIQR
jgi:hypothetical protein